MTTGWAELRKQAVAADQRAYRKKLSRTAWKVLEFLVALSVIASAALILAVLVWAVYYGKYA